MLLVNLLGQAHGERVRQTHAQIPPDGVQIRVVDGLIQRGEEVRSDHVQFRDRGRSHQLHVLRRVQSRRRGREAGQRHHVVNLVRIAPLHHALRRLRQRRLKVQDLLRLALRGLRGIAQQLEHVRQMGHILLAQLDTPGVAAEVVVFLRQAQAALIDVGDFARGILEILLRTVIEEDAD